MKKFYEILGVPENATPDEIKSAYRSLAIKYHPDVSKEADAETKIKKINEAYEVLSDPQKRKNYDLGMNGANRFQGFDFSDFFGNPGSRPHPRRGDDVIVDVVLTLEEVCNPSPAKIINYTCKKTCTTCGGNGIKNIDKLHDCPECNGKAMKVEVTRDGNNIFQRVGPCFACKGTGKRIEDKDRCDDCGGTGFKNIDKTKEIEIPLGIESGQAKVFEGEGHPGQNKGPSGRLIVRFVVEDHDVFTRDGCDLYLNINISYSDILLGAEKDIPTIYGNLVNVKIPPKTKYGGVIRLKGLGCPMLNRNDMRGNLYLIVTYAIPNDEDITEEYMNVINDLKSLEKDIKLDENKNIDSYMEKCNVNYKKSNI